MNTDKFDIKIDSFHRASIVGDMVELNKCKVSFLFSIYSLLYKNGCDEREYKLTDSQCLYCSKGTFCQTCILLTESHVRQKAIRILDRKYGVGEHVSEKR